MACNRPELIDYFTNFSSGMGPVDMVRCPYAADAGAGLGLPLFSLFVFGMIGLALTVRVRHPGPIVVAGMLSAGVVFQSMVGAGALIFALIILVAIIAAGLVIYQRSQSSL